MEEPHHGRRFTAPDDVQPSRAVRQAMWQFGTHADAARLAEIEHAEGWSVTSWARADFEHVLQPAGG